MNKSIFVCLYLNIYSCLSIHFSVHVRVCACSCKRVPAAPLQGPFGANSRSPARPSGARSSPKHQDCKAGGLALADVNYGNDNSDTRQRVLRRTRPQPRAAQQ